MIKPPSWLRYPGQATWFGPLGDLTLSTFTCGHCNKVVVADIGECDEHGRIGSQCKSCNSMICLSCFYSGERCLPFEFKLRDAESLQAQGLPIPEDAW